jgi:hypothetical protein
VRILITAIESRAVPLKPGRDVQTGRNVLSNSLRGNHRTAPFLEWSEDRESGGGGAGGEAGTVEMAQCYSQPEVLSYAGCVDWEVIFRRADIPEQYRQSWRRLVSAGAKISDVPDAHYRWIRRACNSDPWRAKIFSAIQAERRIDPLFACPHPVWGNQKRSNPVAQGTVTTICRSVSVSTTLYWKQDDRPGPLTRRFTKRTVRRFVVGCDGFRANFREGPRLEEYQKSFLAGIARLVSSRWIPEP